MVLYLSVEQQLLIYYNNLHERPLLFIQFLWNSDLRTFEPSHSWRAAMVFIRTGASVSPGLLAVISSSWLSALRIISWWKHTNHVSDFREQAFPLSDMCIKEASCILNHCWLSSHSQLFNSGTKKRALQVFVNTRKIRIQNEGSMNIWRCQPYHR